MPDVATAILTGNPFFTSCLLASALMLVWRLVYRDAGISWAHLLFPPLWSLVSTLILGLSVVARPLTLDRYLYAADGSFGWQPAFAGGRLLLAVPWLRYLCETCYFHLPLAMVAMYLLLSRHCGSEAANRFVRFAVVMAIAGTALFFVFPAAGPGSAFRGDFPDRTPAAALAAILVPRTARNCMPSMHTAWILCLLWSAAPLGRWFRAVLAAFAVFTLLYALSAGGHYLVDLIVAVPFAQAVRSARNAGWKSPTFRLNAMLVAAWFVLLRFGLPLLTASIAVPYSLAAVSLSVNSSWRQSVLYYRRRSERLFVG